MCQTVIYYVFSQSSVLNQKAELDMDTLFVFRQYLEYVFQSSQSYNAFGNFIVSYIVLTIIEFPDVTSVLPFPTLK